MIMRHLVLLAALIAQATATKEHHPGLRSEATNQVKEDDDSSATSFFRRLLRPIRSTEWVTQLSPTIKPAQPILTVTSVTVSNPSWMNVLEEEEEEEGDDGIMLFSGNGATGTTSTSCPPALVDACTLEYRPLSCGANECIYSNSCFALGAGFNPEDDCVDAPEDSPDAASTFSAFLTPINPSNGCPIGDDNQCTFDGVVARNKPSLCVRGDLICRYVNPCQAETTGFDFVTECIRETSDESQQSLATTTVVATTACPVASDGFCTADFSEVICGDNQCKYSNSCWATVAGFDPDTDCIATSEPATVSQAEFLTPINLLTGCPNARMRQCATDGVLTDPNPTLCIRGTVVCPFASPCLARSTGFVVADECTTTGGELNLDRGELVTSTATKTTTTVTQLDGCPIPENGLCTLDFDRVECGPKKCIYSNKCWATEAGFNPDNDCADFKEVPMTVTSPEQGFLTFIDSATGCPMPVSRQCTFDGVVAGNKPTVCTRNSISCRYENPCLAETTGYDLITECERTDGSGAFNDNDLIALARDRLEDDTVFSETPPLDDEDELEWDDPSTWGDEVPPEYEPCPGPTDFAKCTSDLDVVVCENVNDPSLPPSCVYNNPCLADQSGFTADMCSAPDPDRSGTTDVSLDLNGCPLPSLEDSRQCPMTYVPVICSRGEYNACVYTNACYSEAATFNTQTDCIGV